MPEKDQAAEKLHALLVGLCSTEVDRQILPGWWSMTSCDRFGMMMWLNSIMVLLLLGGCSGNGEGTPGKDGQTGQQITYSCKEILPTSFIESQLGATIHRYDEQRSTNAQGEPVLPCSFEVGKDTTRRGGSLVVGLGDLAEYQNNLSQSKLTFKKVAEKNDICQRSFEIGPIDINKTLKAQQAHLVFLSSKGYFVTVIVSTFWGEPAMPHTRALAKEACANLKV